MWQAVLVAALGLLAAIKLYLRLIEGRCGEARLDGQTAVVTGSNCGLGLETARDLAARGARVILACRDASRGEQAADIVRASTGNSSVVYRHLDLSSLHSIRHFAQHILNSESRLDMLVHNAGMTPSKAGLATEDGLELQWAVNHLGPFLLTSLLLPLLLRTKNACVVFVASVTHWWARLDTAKDLDGPRAWVQHPYWTYCSTKLANVLIAGELGRRLEHRGVAVSSVSPGGVRTAIARNMAWPVRALVVPVLWPFLKSPRAGAQTTVWAAVTRARGYLVDCAPALSAPWARDTAAAARLWDESCRLLDIDPRWTDVAPSDKLECK
ncbi:hypothetical protein LAZ67_18000178 [Cordylochernes scorpioides]|uniref:Retinol dehydrogenase 12 n=1 Tax=Cordylochernes scorpioides TaxID=51811 RepID=A0ABY6LEQ3_9ARAC|nr:hypothetical protein LAZ67_18000176 [Cordylochernes scorpioides]UYV79651.1 hypothetical protein LAZ67_18000178 [Cordylochernes scorpioides]